MVTYGTRRGSESLKVHRDDFMYLFDDDPRQGLCPWQNTRMVTLGNGNLQRVWGSESLKAHRDGVFLFHVFFLMMNPAKGSALGKTRAW